MLMFSAENVFSFLFLIFTGRMSEGDSVGDSIHGKPSVVSAFFTRIGQVKYITYNKQEMVINDCMHAVTQLLQTEKKCYWWILKL